MKAGVLVLSEAMAKRITACMKACDGIPTGTLERYYGNQGGIDEALKENSLRDHASAVIEKNRLLEVLQQVVMLAQEVHDHWDKDRDAKVGKYLMALSGYLPGYDARTDEIHAAIAVCMRKSK